MARITLNLAESSYADLQNLSAKHGRSMSNLIRLGLSIVKVALEQQEANNKLVIATPEGKGIREIFFPPEVADAPKPAVLRQSGNP